MGTSVRETAEERFARLRNNADAYQKAIKAGTHTQADLDAYLKEENVTADDIKRSFGEKFEDVRSTFLAGVPGANRARAGYQAIANLAGIGTQESPEESLAAQKAGIARFEGDHPLAALGAQVTSGAVLPLGPLTAGYRRLAPAVKLPGFKNLVNRGARAAGDLALTGISQGANAADLRDADPTTGAAIGAGAALGLGGLLGVGGAGIRAVRNAVSVPAAREAALSGVDALAQHAGGTGAMRAEMATRRAAGGQPMAFELLGDQGEASLRASTNAPLSGGGGVASRVLGERSAQALPRSQANIRKAAGLGTDEPGKVRDRMIGQRLQATDPVYKAAQAEGASGQFRAGPAVKAFRKMAEDNPLVRTLVRESQQLPNLTNKPADSFDVLDDIYRGLNGRIRDARMANDSHLVTRLNAVRAPILDAISERAPTYRKAAQLFAEESVPLNSFAAGQKFRDLDPYDIKNILARGELPNGYQADPAAFRAGMAEDLLAIVSSNGGSPKLAGAASAKNPLLGLNNADLDRKLKAGLGDQYDEMIPTFVQILREEAAKQRVLGGSNTARKLADLGGDPLTDAISGFVGAGSGALGFGAGAAMRRGAVGGARSVFDKITSGQAGKVGTETAGLLTQSGGGLDDLLKLIDERAAIARKGRPATPTSVGRRALLQQASRTGGLLAPRDRY